MVFSNYYVRMMAKFPNMGKNFRKALCFSSGILSLWELSWLRLNITSYVWQVNLYRNRLFTPQCGILWLSSYSTNIFGSRLLPRTQTRIYFVGWECQTLMARSLLSLRGSLIVRWNTVQIRRNGVVVVIGYQNILLKYLNYIKYFPY